uniref:Uncharacterized protein n=1 Tax=Physcomitrium patens TaxID=3218 RepID=A0A2K1KLS6_PHYPA|nr:hypothetical protein PHYPA_005615 [Physcomitrium patens]
MVSFAAQWSFPLTVLLMIPNLRPRSSTKAPLFLFTVK